LSLLFFALAGTALVIACGCVYNNYLDREIDKKMDRTKQRALVTRSVSAPAALVYGTLLGTTGFWLLYRYVNLVTVWVGVVGLIFYVALYGYSKRRSIHGTLVGSVAGAMPVTAGYTAVTGRFDQGAVLVLLILIFWQMAHFYSIGLYRLKDYKAAGLPILPVIRGAKQTRRQIFLYIVGFMAATSLLTLYNFTGYIYLLVMIIISLLWLRKGFGGKYEKDDSQWGKRMFLFSLNVILIVSIMLALGPLLP
jgi:heme o synthase